MAHRGMHLLKDGKTACGMRNATLAGKYEVFLAASDRCEKCAQSKYAAFLARVAAEKNKTPGAA